MIADKSRVGRCLMCIILVVWLYISFSHYKLNRKAGGEYEKSAESLRVAFQGVRNLLKAKGGVTNGKSESLFRECTEIDPYWIMVSVFFFYPAYSLECEQKGSGYLDV